jgi:protein tyrosine phosphatase (PTP) superfamily phosphohydrolase (DUF442 family)
MKSKISILFILLVLTFSAIGQVSQQETSKLDSVEVIDDFNNFYKSGDYYFGGQPSSEALDWLQSEGVSLIINLRSEGENRDFSKESFNEKKAVKKLNIEYTSIPVSYPDSYSPETLSVFVKELSAHKGKVFIHCKSAGRVRLFFMAYLVEDKGYTLNEAFEFGKQMDYYLPLEDIFGKKIKMTF